MSEYSEILVIPSKMFGSFYVCQIQKAESRYAEPIESLIAIDFEKILSPNEGRKVIARIHANNIIQCARKVLETSTAYIHSCQNGNYVFTLAGFLKKESDSHTLVREIENKPTSFPANDLFKERVMLYKVSQT